MDRDPESFVRALGGCVDPTAQYATIDSLAKRGAADLLYSIAIALEAHGKASGAERWILEGAFDRIERSLALQPARDNAAKAIDLLSIERVATVQRPRNPWRVARHVASRLAQGQPPAVCFELAGRYVGGVAKK